MEWCLERQCLTDDRDVQASKRASEPLGECPSGRTPVLHVKAADSAATVDSVRSCGRRSRSVVPHNIAQHQPFAPRLAHPMPCSARTREARSHGLSSPRHPRPSLRNNCCSGLGSPASFGFTSPLLSNGAFENRHGMKLATPSSPPAPPTTAPEHSRPVPAFLFS